MVVQLAPCHPPQHTLFRLPVPQQLSARPLLLTRSGRHTAGAGAAGTVALAVGPLERPLDGRIEVQRILALAEQLHHRLAVHQLVQALRRHVHVDVRRLRAVHVQRDPVACKAQRQRAQRGRLVHAGDGQLLGVRVRIGGQVERDARLLAIQEEAELVAKRREIDHEQGLDGDLELASRSVRETIFDG